MRDKLLPYSMLRRSADLAVVLDLHREEMIPLSSQAADYLEGRETSLTSVQSEIDYLKETENLSPSGDLEILDLPSEEYDSPFDLHVLEVEVSSETVFLLTSELPELKKLNIYSFVFHLFPDEANNSLLKSISDFLWELGSPFAQSWAFKSSVFDSDEEAIISSWPNNKSLVSTNQASKSSYQLPVIFGLNYENHLKSISFNTYYHKRLGINASLMIGPTIGPSDVHFGEMNGSIYSNVIEPPAFIKELWQVNKSQIEPCSSCMFSSVCIDPDLLIKLTKGKYVKSVACSKKEEVERQIRQVLQAELSTSTSTEHK